MDHLNIDLHTHSTCSDGTLPPAMLVAHAAAAGIEVLALTDHDSIAGLAEAQAAAQAHGITLVPGVEISAAWRGQSIHVLGLWIDPANAALQAALASQAMRRTRRMQAICAQLGERGLPGEALLAAASNHGGLPTRSHLAAALVAGGHARTTDDAFRRFLGRGKAAQLAADWPAVREVTGWITAAGGIATLAHPGRYKLSAGGRRQLFAEFAASGGTAMEVVSGPNAAHNADACARWAQAHGLAGSAGSDFHDPQLSWNPLGRLAKLPPGVTPVWRDRLG